MNSNTPVYLEDLQEILRVLNLKGDAISRANIQHGTLNPEQSERFLDLTAEESVLLKLIRNERRQAPSGEINKMLIGQPITRGADIYTGTNYAQTFGNALRTEKVPYVTKKLISYYRVPTEILEENIEQANFSATLARAAAKQYANDLERLAILGDESMPDPQSGDEAVQANYYLLVANDGFLKQITAQNGAHVYDANGAAFDNRLVSKAWRMLPSKYKTTGKDQFKLLASLNIEQDYRDFLTARGTELGDRNLQGLLPVRPYGIELIGIPFWPENLGQNNDKTKILLTVPTNLIWVVSREIRTYVFFREEADATFSVTYTRCDFVVENQDAIVVIENVTPGAVVD